MSGEKIVQGEVVGGPPPSDPKPAVKRSGSFFHPLSGAVILGIDWLAFGLDLASGFLLLALMSIAAFAAAFFCVSRVQRRLAGDDAKQAAVKALIGAFAAGIPYPITGTVIGAAILALSRLRK